MCMVRFVSSNLEIDEAPVSALKALKLTGTLRGILLPQEISVDNISTEEVILLSEIGVKSIPDGSRGIVSLSFADF